MKTKDLAKATKIKLLILDVDGVLTDGKLYYSREGESLKVFHVHDGAGIKQLLKQGIHIAVISARSSAAVQTRLNELGVKHIYQGQTDKTIAFHELCQKLKVSPNECAYVGDDLADIAVMKLVALPIAVANAVLEVKAAALYVTEMRGGEGAVREVCELILANQS
ncbi:MAG TPA: HAD-IIIA family hydrolase [Coxiellaceae bacterium]|nr:HAD-IIIA family hydrolase [Coxiellaceae bacterium]